MDKLTTKLLLLSSLLIFSGCQQNIDKPLKPKIDVNLPTIQNSSIRFIPDITTIALEWKGNFTSVASGYNIYRTDMKSGKKRYKRIASISNKYQTHYLDTNLEPNTKYSYAISMVSKNNIESKPSESKIISTLESFDSVSLIEALSGLPKQIKILWRPHMDAGISHYLLERKSPLENRWIKLAKIPHRYNVEYIDKDLKDNKTFYYRLKAVKFNNIESKNSQIVEATTKSLPKPVLNLKATMDLPRKIKVSWELSPTTDVIHYNIYRASSVNGSYDKIAQASSTHNTFDNNVAKDGKTYFYKITATDKDGLESDIRYIQPTMGSTLNKPSIPQITLAQIQGDKIIINWINNDTRGYSYNLYKTTSGDWGSKNIKIIKDIKGLRFEDKDVLRGVEYRYSLQAVDKYGIQSEQTQEFSSMLPKIIGNK